MRDSALKLPYLLPRYTSTQRAGNELMRDSALKHDSIQQTTQMWFVLEMSSCATAL